LVPAELTRTRATGAAALAALVASLLATLPGCGGEAAPGAQRQVARTLALDGVTASQFAGTTLERRLHADQLRVVPKRFGLFGIAGLDELVLARARLELFDPPGAAAAARDGDRTASSLRLLEMAAAGRRIAGASIHGFEIDVTRGGELAARVSAALGRLEARTRDLVLEGFTVEQRVPVARSVRGARAVWRMRENAIVVDGAYELRDGARVTAGTGLRISLGG
jgi:hypothetical protein